VTGGDATVERLLAAARAETGLADFGDPSFREGLEQLVRSVETQADLNPIGQAAFEAQVTGGLVNRLRVVHWHAQHPAVDDARIEAPIIIAGLPRSGTTALSHLLGCDPANRSLMGWEASSSVPPPRAATAATDPRFVAALEADGMLALINPGFKAIHHDPPDQPFECVVVLAQHFHSAIFPTEFTVPDYDEWMLAADARPAYEYHRSVLQVLQSEHPGRWQLKTPHHGLAIDAVAATYPDARFVITHRDPVKAVASVLSLVDSLSTTFSDVDHRDYIAQHWPPIMAEICDRVVDFRERNPDTIVHDMAYREIVDDPVGAIRAMYATFGEELSPEAEAAMTRYSRESPQGVHGRHEYRLADFGHDRSDVAPRFERYLERHDIEREDA
jgi:hypothetical protein